MATVDVVTDTVINRPRGEVAAYVCDPDNATAWYANIDSVRWTSPKPAVQGSRLEFVARFLGRTLTYTYEVIDVVPGERFVMRTAEGPFPMQTTYTWADTPEGGTRMTLRNSGEPAGFSRAVTPLMTIAMRRANTNDLSTLKKILESP